MRKPCIPRFPEQVGDTPKEARLPPWPGPCRAVGLSLLPGGEGTSTTGQAFAVIHCLLRCEAGLPSSFEELTSELGLSALWGLS